MKSKVGDQGESWLWVNNERVNMQGGWVGVDSYVVV